MTDIPDAGRQVAHVILDAVTAWDPEIDSEGDENAVAMNLALHRLNEIDGAVGIEVDGDHVGLDLSNVTGGTIVLVNWLVHRLSEARREDPNVIVSRAREFLDD